MDVSICFEGCKDDVVSYNLFEIKTLLERDYSYDVFADKISKARVKDGGLIIGLTIAGLGLSAISAIVSTLSYWLSRKPKYKISLVLGDKTYEISNLSEKRM